MWELKSQERNMKLNQKSGATIAMTAAALIVSGTLATSAFAAGGTDGNCFGVNGFMGKGACTPAHNDCMGQNACTGTGFVMMSDTACAVAGGQFVGYADKVAAGPAAASGRSPISPDSNRQGSAP
jgi:hypothetical protein